MADVQNIPVSQAGPSMSTEQRGGRRGPRRRRGGAQAQDGGVSLEGSPQMNSATQTTVEPSQPSQPSEPADELAVPKRNRNRRKRGGVEGQKSMEASDTEVQSGVSLTETIPVASRGNRGRGRGRGGREGQQSSEVSEAELQAGPSMRREPTAAAAASTRSRGRGGRGGSSMPVPRGFGGKLTNEDDDDAASTTTSLNAGASDFTPGQPITIAGPSNQLLMTVQSGIAAKKAQDARNAPPREPKKPKTVKEAEDLMTRIHDSINSGSYECMICYGGVTRKAKVWDCRRCYAVFHLNCITKWAKQALTQPVQGNEEIQQRERTWRCPGCQNALTEAPGKYTCWCEKSESPAIDRYAPPHSCGDTCGKARETPRSCPHACDLQCHAGPCPPCTAMGPALTCFCGKEERRKRCIDTDYEGGWTCGQICGDDMPCGEHKCEKTCHQGLCGACEVAEELMCYCGAEEKEIKCCDKLEPEISEMEEGGGVERWEGHFECGKKCERMFDCGVHQCTKGCHPQEAELAHCPYSPDVVDHCPCGKTSLEEFTPRQSCEDSIPHCDKVCEKTLKCGHTCRQTCHTGDCGMCFEYIDVSCRCGRTSSRSLCHQGEPGEPPMCYRVCHASSNCQRHTCGEKCCPGEQHARERTSTKKKAAVRTATEDIEPEHICTRVCDRPLKCGNHTCTALCHRGQCGSCLEANFDELACNCGRTRLMPPIPCGTKPPVCNYPCTRVKACGHPNAKDHNCHSNDEDCPRCPYLVDKICLCGKRTIKNQPCWREIVSCGQECGHRLSCGSHACHKVCHVPGACEEPCKQVCGKPRMLCSHPDQEPCHAPFACTELLPCTAKKQISCPCGHYVQEVKCNTCKSNPLPKRPEVKCNAACRSRKLAQALNVDLDARAEKESNQNLYNPEVMGYYADHKVWCTGIEKTIRAFCADDSKQRLSFQPMKSPLREFIHSLVEDYDLDSESEDPEPYRSVVITKNSRFIMPRRTLAEALKMAKAGASGIDTPSAPAIAQLRKPAKQAVNAILLSGIHVGLLATELSTELDKVFSTSQLRITHRWIGGEEILIEPRPSSMSPDQVESALESIKPTLRKACVGHNIASSVELVWVGRDGAIAKPSVASAGWAMVDKGARKMEVKPVNQTYANAYGVLGGQSFAAVSKGRAVGNMPVEGSPAPGMIGTGAYRPPQKRKEKEKVVQEEIVEDWEEAADSDEAEEVGRKELDVKDNEDVVMVDMEMAKDMMDVDEVDGGDQEEAVLVEVADDLQQINLSEEIGHEVAAFSSA